MLDYFIESNGCAINALRAEIKPEDYRRAANANFWCNSKPGEYGRGFSNTPDDPNKVTRVGLLGEIALGEYLNQPVDFEYREKGRHHDFLINTHKIDVKTSTQRRKDEGIITYKDEGRNQIYGLHCDIYVFGFVIEEDRAKETAQVALVGWIERENISVDYVRMGNFSARNYYIPYSILYDMRSLKDYLLL